MIKNFLCLLMSTLVLSACASYGGLTPDYSLSGDDGRQEVDDFTIKAGAWGSPVVEMGGKAYYMDSLTPLFANVSDDGAKKLDRAIWLERAGWVSLAAAVAVIFFRGSNVTAADNLAFFTFLGVGAGLTYLRVQATDEAIDQYNRDLRQKFNPGLSWNYQF